LVGVLHMLQLSHTSLCLGRACLLKGKWKNLENLFRDCKRSILNGVFHFHSDLYLYIIWCLKCRTSSVAFCYLFHEGPGKFKWIFCCLINSTFKVILPQKGLLIMWLRALWILYKVFICASNEHVQVYNRNLPLDSMN